MKHLRKNVFYPPILLIFCTILFSQINNDLFSTSISKLNTWILENFGFLFSWSSFFFLVLLLITYFSPLAQVKIGGKNAKPLLSKSRWFAISTCTTIATGILFWGCAEPLFHYANHPYQQFLLHQMPLWGFLYLPCLCLGHLHPMPYTV